MSCGLLKSLRCVVHLKYSIIQCRYFKVVPTKRLKKIITLLPPRSPKFFHSRNDSGPCAGAANISGIHQIF